MFEFVPPPSVVGVLLVARGIRSDDGGSLYWDVGGVLVGVSLWWVLGVEMVVSDFAHYLVHFLSW